MSTPAENSPPPDATTPATVIEDDDEQDDDAALHLLNGAGGDDGDLDYYMDDAAYALMVQHACKNSSSAVIGLVLGMVSPYNKTQYTLTKVVPLSHSDLVQFTTPLTEVALTLVEQHCEQHASGLKIVGVYYAPALPGVPRQVQRVVDKIHHNNRLRLNTPLFVLDAERMTPQRRTQRHCVGSLRFKSANSTKFASAKDAAKASVHVSAKALHVANLLLLPPNSKIRMTSHVAHVSNYDVADFEDHCLDPRADFLNAHLVKLLDAVLDNPSSTPPSVGSK